MKEKRIFCEHVSEPSNLPDELGQNVSKNIHVGRFIPPLFLQKFRIWPFFFFFFFFFFIYLHDSNSFFFGPGELIQKYFRAAQHWDVGIAYCTCRHFLRNGTEENRGSRVLHRELAQEEMHEEVLLGYPRPVHPRREVPQEYV